MCAIKEKTYHQRQSKAAKPWRTTPLVESVNLSKAAGCRRSRIFLKLENLQPSGSFKSRGLGNLVLRTMERAREPEKVHFYASSGGNAGLGVVMGAEFVGRPSTVVVPKNTKPHMIAKLRAAGAFEVLQHGDNIKEADAYLKEHIMPLARARGEEPIYVSPFDHPDIWEGHSSMVDEMAAQFQDLGESAPSLIICSCGGGGLFNGLMQGIQRQEEGSAWDSTKILAVNTLGADALATSLAAGQPTPLSKITSIATSLATGRISDETFNLFTSLATRKRALHTVLSDAEAAMGSWKFAEDERMLVEPACGVNIALCYGNRLKKVLGRTLGREEKVVIVLCGGSNVTTGMVEEWKRKYANLVEEDVLAGVKRRKESEGKGGGKEYVDIVAHEEVVSAAALAVKPPPVQRWLGLVPS